MPKSILTKQFEKESDVRGCQFIQSSGSQNANPIINELYLPLTWLSERQIECTKTNQFSVDDESKTSSNFC